MSDEEEAFDPHEAHHGFYLQRGAAIARLIERIDLEVNSTKSADEQDAVLMELAAALLAATTRTEEDALIRHGADFPQHEDEAPGTQLKAAVAMVLIGAIGMYADSKVMGDDASHATRAVSERAKEKCIKELMPKIELVMKYIDVLQAEEGLKANDMLRRALHSRGHEK